MGNKKGEEGAIRGGYKIRRGRRGRGGEGAVRRGEEAIGMVGGGGWAGQLDHFLNRSNPLWVKN